MRKLLIPLLAAFLLPISVEANWFDSRKNLLGKYRSKIDADMACYEWSKKDQKDYFYAKDPEDSRIGKIYEKPEASTIFPSNGIFESTHLLTKSTLIPALVGSPGPGEITKALGFRPINLSMPTLSFLKTLTFCPKSPRK